MAKPKKKKHSELVGIIFFGKVMKNTFKLVGLAHKIDTDPKSVRNQLGGSKIFIGCS